MSSKAIARFGREPKVTLLRFSSLGDIVLTLPVVDSLKKAVPGARVTYITKKSFAPLLEGNDGIERVLALGEEGGGSGLTDLLRLCRRGGKTDLVVDLHGNLRSRLCRLFIGAPSVIGGREVLKRRLLARGITTGGEVRHVVDRYLEALEKVGINPESRTPRLMLKAGEREAAARMLRQAGVEDPAKTVVLAPGAKWPNKEWPAGCFARAARMLNENKGLQPVVVGEASDGPAARDLLAMAGPRAVDLTGRTGLRELAAVIALAAVFIGNDSGPGHIAAAVGTATVILFGPTSEAFGFSPRGRFVQTVSLPLDCRPCSLHGGKACRRGVRSCLEDVEPERVYQAAVSLMDRMDQERRDGKAGMEE